MSLPRSAPCQHGIISSRRQQRRTDSGNAIGRGSRIQDAGSARSLAIRDGYYSYSDISAAYRALVAKTFLSATLAKFLFNRGRT
jgi:hypothetical protein